MSSLILIAIGNGSIRACITSLGGHQFQLPEQSKQLDRFFSQYYFIYSTGILCSKIIPPAIRVQTQCFGKNDCYLAVFGSLATIFLAAWSEYSTACTIDQPWANVRIWSTFFSRVPDRYVFLQRRRDRRSRWKYLFSGYRLCVAWSRPENTGPLVSHIDQ